LEKKKKKKKAVEKKLKEEEAAEALKKAASGQTGEVKPTFASPSSVTVRGGKGAGEDAYGEEDSILKLKKHLINRAAQKLKKLEDDLLLKR